MKNILLVLIALSIPLQASPTGILDWIGDPSIRLFSSNGYATSPTFLTDPNGITTSLYDYRGGRFLEDEYVVTSQFEVTTAGGFQITNSASVEGFGDPVDPVNEIGNLVVTFDGSGFGMESVGSAEELAVPSTPDIPIWTPITATASRSDVVTLGIGTYTLSQGMDAIVQAVDNPLAIINYSTDIVGVDPPDAVPEPHDYLWIIVIAAVLWVVIQALRGEKKGNLP
jgi:hypothetical protein